MDVNITLNNLPISSGAYISSVNLEGSMRRRLLDFGFTTGAFVVPLFKSPLGDPTAYEVMGSVVALRSDIASKISTSEHSPIVKTEADNQ